MTGWVVPAHVPPEIVTRLAKVRALADVGLKVPADIVVTPPMVMVLVELKVPPWISKGPATLKALLCVSMPAVMVTLMTFAVARLTVKLRSIATSSVVKGT